MSFESTDDPFDVFNNTTSIRDTTNTINTTNTTNTPNTINYNNTKVSPVTTYQHTRHLAVTPLSTTYVPLTLTPSSKTYPFKLDTFQLLAINAIERNESVLVSAHTSSGKTLVAEHAIQLCISNNQRVIYTSPIKALSNQKYRELSEQFTDVGLMTGDVTLNPSSSCIVMTTEILRNMLYKGSEILREVRYIIFDEIHYMKDKERGVVWEESIVLLPVNVRMVFLSATIPNALQFAEWITHIHQQTTHVIYTDKRPTPLIHYIAPLGDKGMTKVCYQVEGNGLEGVNDRGSDYKGDSNCSGKQQGVNDRGSDYKSVSKSTNNQHGVSNSTSNYKGVNDSTSNNPTNTPTNATPTTFFDQKAFSSVVKSIRRNKRVEGKNIFQITETLIENNNLPAIFFSFSRKDCEKYALEVEEDFLSAEEKKMVKIIFDNALSTLRVEDRNLPLIANILPLLMKGIGIHHSGLLPLLKEVVEILFQENLLKILFATETFSIGLNMPAKSVIFTSLFKFDGSVRRILSSGEYIQMSGRAGRRGLDDKGVVIVMLGESIGIDEGCKLFSGECDRLDSAFYLSYNMVLNLMRVEGLDPLFLLGRSFFHFQKIRSREEVSEEIKRLENIMHVDLDKREGLDSNYNTRVDRGGFDSKYNNNPTNSNRISLLWLERERLLVERSASLQEVFKQYLKVGRLINCFLPREGATIFFNAIIISKNLNTLNVNAFMRGSIKRMNVLCTCINKIYDARVKEDFLFEGSKKVSFIGIRSEYDERIWEIEGEMSSIGCRIDTGCYLCGREEIGIKCLEETCYDPLKCEDFIEGNTSRDKRDSISKDRYNSPNPNSTLSYFRSLYCKSLYLKKTNILKSLNEIYHMEDCKKMISVLRRLEYCDINNTVLAKGRVACEISSGDELILTEMVFNGDFISLGVDEIVPLLSCMVFSEWEEENEISEQNNKTYRLLKSTVDKILKVMNECGLSVDVQCYYKKFSYELMDVVRMWVLGFTFSEICSKTNVFEGSIIRCFRRLEELLRQLSSAARGIGNSELEGIFSLGVTKIKRDIVFASSLYL